MRLFAQLELATAPICAGHHYRRYGSGARS